MMSNRLVRASRLLVMICFLVAPSLISQTWAPQQTSVPSNFSAVKFFDQQIGYISGAYGVIFKTIDGGANWIQKPSGTNVNLADQYFIDATTGWTVGQNGVILKTADGGNSWTRQTSGTANALNCVYFFDAQNGWAAGANGTMLKTSNGGTTWTPQPPATNASIQRGWFVGSSIFFACDDGTLIRSVDSGASWQTQWLNHPLLLSSVFFTTPNIGWAVGANGRIKKTTNGGEMWYIQDDGTTQQLNAVFFVNADTGWIAGNGGIIKMSTNGGATWTSQISSTTKNLRSLYLCNGSHGFAVGDSNTVLEYSITDPLPIQLASFTAAIVNDNSVRLNWRTISEINNYGFEVERAIGSPASFLTITSSIIPGHGTTNEPQNYTFIDANAVSGRLYYRLKQIDLDGSVNYTDPIAVDVLTDVDETKRPTEFSLKQNYPNPFNPSTKIEFSIARTGYVSLKVYDILGREVATLVNDQLSQGNYAKTFVAGGLSSGVYWYKLASGNFSETKKFILSK